MLLEDSPSGQSNSAPSPSTSSHQVAGASRLHGRVEREPATYSNRATRALGDVLRRLIQPRGRRCRGTPDLSNR
jgi:hypothetical protein